MTLVLLNIALVPEKKFSDIAIDLSRKLSKEFKTEFILSEIGPFPHVTLYFAEFPTENIPKIIEEIKNIHIDKIEIQRVNGINISNGYINFEIELTNELRDIHSEVLEKISKYRDGNIREKWLYEVKEMSEGEQENLANYGSTGRKTYKPHLTLAKLVDEALCDDEEIKKIINLKQFVFKTIEIGVFKAGSRGTCLKRL